MRYLWAVALCVGGCSTHPLTTPTAAPVGISDDFLNQWVRVEHAEADLDHDGTAERFIGNPSAGGNAGQPYLVLQRRGDRWYPMGEIFLNLAAFRVLPAAPDGSIRVARYWRLGGSEGKLDTLTWRGGEFVVIASESIHPGDSGTEQGRLRYAAFLAQGTGLNQRAK
jgi:hypothetical protein